MAKTLKHLNNTLHVQSKPMISIYGLSLILENVKMAARGAVALFL